MKRNEATRGALPAFSAIGAWLIPAWGCPVCLSAFAATMSSLGLGFMATEAVLTPLTALLLAVALVALAFGARRKERYGPLLLGCLSAAVLVASKFSAEQPWLGYVGLAALLAASVWDAQGVARRPLSRERNGDASMFNKLTERREDGYETNR